MDIIIGIIFISIIGTLLHFMYEFSGHNKIVSLFAAVNESTWEHIKIALTPTFIWTLYDGAIYGMNENYSKNIKHISNNNLNTITILCLSINNKKTHLSSGYNNILLGHNYK